MDTTLPTRFPIPFADAAVAPYVRAIPTASQIGVQAGAASLTDGFPPVTFDTPGAGGTPPFGEDFNGILKQITQWVRYTACAGGPVTFDATFAAAIGGYPKGAILADVSITGVYWWSTKNGNTTDPVTPAQTDWQVFSVNYTGVTVGTYTRPKITITGDGKISAAENGAYPTHTNITSGSGNYATPTNAKRLRIRMVAGGGGGGGPGGSGSNGVATSFNSIVANPGIGAATNTGAASPSAGSGTANLRIPGAAGNDGGLLNVSSSSRAMGGPGGHAAFFSGGGKASAGAGVPNTGGGGGGTSQDGTSPIGGGGGSAGEYVEYVINNPSGNYAYVVGTGGAGGGGGGAGGSGQIVIEVEYD